MSDDRTATHNSGGAGHSSRREGGLAEAEVAKLRRSMIQQLTASGKLLHAVFTLDRDYFGSRFTGGDQPEGGGDPFQELGLATKIVETLAEELQGSTAFADSPVLRDNMTSLVAGVGEARLAAIELERTQLDALHLPQKTEFAARTYPDNNPLACLTETVGFLRELGTALRRAKDRAGAARLMLHEAEKGRQEAESSGAPAGKPDEVATQLRAELQARDNEVAQLRTQGRQIQEQAAGDLRRLQQHVDQLRQDLGREQDLRRGDLAEVRSLAAEVERFASVDEQLAAREGRSDGRQLAASLTGLREVLADPQRGEAIPAAAESVLIEWARVVTARAHQASAEIARLRGDTEALQLAVQQQREQLGRLAELDKQGADLVRSREAVKALEGDLASARAQAATAFSDAAKLRSDVARIDGLERELVRAQDARKLAENSVLALGHDKEALATRVATLEGQLGERVRVAADELAAARTEISQTRGVADESLARERQLVSELAKAREAIAQANAQSASLKAQLTAVGEERAQLQAKVDQSKDHTGAITRDRDRAQAEQQRQIQALHEQIAELQDAAEERAKLLGKIDEMRRTSTVVEEKSRVDRDDAGRQIVAAREQFAEEQQLHIQARQERDQLRARLDDLRRTGEAQSKQAADSQAQLGRELAAMRETEARLKSQVASSSAEANRAAARASELERELSSHRDQAAARARDHAQAIEQLRARETEARDKGEALAAELAQTKSKATRLETDLVAAERKATAGRAASERRVTHIVASAPAPAPAVPDGSAVLRQRVAEMQQLLLDARAAVVAAKQRSEQLATTDREIISELMTQVATLKQALKNPAH